MRLKLNFWLIRYVDQAKTAFFACSLHPDKNKSSETRGNHSTFILLKQSMGLTVRCKAA